MASSVCRSLQCLISTLTQGGEVVFCLGSLVQLCCGGRNTANKYHWHVWGVLTVSQPHWVCPHSQHVFFPSLRCSGSRLLCRKQALGCVHFPGLSRSGSGSQVFHEGTDLVWPAFCVLPRSEQLRRPGAWLAQSPQVVSVSYHLPVPAILFPG